MKRGSMGLSKTFCLINHEVDVKCKFNLILMGEWCVYKLCECIIKRRFLRAARDGIIMVLRKRWLKFNNCWTFHCVHFYSSAEKECNFWSWYDTLFIVCEYQKFFFSYLWCFVFSCILLFASAVGEIRAKGRRVQIKDHFFKVKTDGVRKTNFRNITKRQNYLHLK